MGGRHRAIGGSRGIVDPTLVSRWDFRKRESKWSCPWAKPRDRAFFVMISSTAEWMRSDLAIEVEGGRSSGI